VYADDRGHWPWETGFRGGRGGQPVLGAREASGEGAIGRDRRDSGAGRRDSTDGGKRRGT
jgi:hypothetical protein